MTKSPLIIIAVLVALGGGYWYFFTGSSQEPPLTASEVTNPSEQRFIDLSSTLSSISFDTGIFRDPRFLSLIDLTTPIAHENQGRRDPFAPLGR